MPSAVFKASSKKKGIETVKAVVDKVFYRKSEVVVLSSREKNLMFQAETALNFIVGVPFVRFLLYSEVTALLL